MGILLLEFSFLRLASEKGLLSQNTDILEFEEAELCNLDLNLLLNDPLFAGRRDGCIHDTNNPPSYYLNLLSFHHAKLLYRLLFDYRSCFTVDFGGSSLALKADLNNKVDLGRQFGLVINNGTSEHIFNQYQ